MGRLRCQNAFTNANELICISARQQSSDEQLTAGGRPLSWSCDANPAEPQIRRRAASSLLRMILRLSRLPHPQLILNQNSPVAGDHAPDFHLPTNGRVAEAYPAAKYSCMVLVGFANSCATTFGTFRCKCSATERT